VFELRSISNIKNDLILVAAVMMCVV
jgi:hypothetical protein